MRHLKIVYESIESELLVAVLDLPLEIAEQLICDLMHFLLLSAPAVSMH